MEKVEVAIRVLSVGYALGICGMILRLQGRTFAPAPGLASIVSDGPLVCVWPSFRFCREYQARRRMVVLPEKKPKKRPDIAVASEKAVQRTQAEILAEQRERVKNLHGVGEKKLRPKAPKRKGPPSKKS
ncbi:hypothetical protein BBJ28_00012052 [Nothophytophthora sp. Chile5]|nr:hypothetical protein BBJ28_00012052 [Nothophytophthora sp. Chile5]